MTPTRSYTTSDDLTRGTEHSHRLGELRRLPGLRVTAQGRRVLDDKWGGTCATRPAPWHRDVKARRSGSVSATPAAPRPEEAF